MGSEMCIRDRSTAATAIRIEMIEEAHTGDDSSKDTAPLGVEADQKTEEVDLSELDDAFHQVGEYRASTKELDAFWDSAAEQTGVEHSSESGSISYEQAQRLGIAPSEDAE